MSEESRPDALHDNLKNGRHSPFKRLPQNEMMLMTDRRARQFLTRVLTTLDSHQAGSAAGDSDLTPIHYFDITQDLGLQGEHYSEYERPWQYFVFPALQESIVARWEECMAANPDKPTLLTGEQVADSINTVVLRQFNVPMKDIITLEMVTRDKPAFQPLRDHFSETVAPYRPTHEYNHLVYGNVWQSMIADCMHRRDTVSLGHILTEGKKQAPEALSDAIAFMVGGISGNSTCPENFEKEEVAVLVNCMPSMIFSKENTSRALHNILSYRKIHDEYGLYDAALDLVIQNSELQTSGARFGYEMEKSWLFEEIEELIKRLTQGGVPTSYIVSRVFIGLVNCEEDVFGKLDTLIPADATDRDKRIWDILKEGREQSGK